MRFLNSITFQVFHYLYDADRFKESCLMDEHWWLIWYSKRHGECVELSLCLWIPLLFHVSIDFRLLLSMLKTFLACLFCFPNSDRMVFSWPCEAKKAIKFHHFGEIAKANCLRRYFVKKMFSCVWSRLTCSHTCSTSFNRLFIKLPPLCKSCEIIKVDINYNL